MTTIVLAQRADFDAALEAATAVLRAPVLPDLAAPLGAAVRGWARDAWDIIAVALEDAWSYGEAAIADAVTTATSAVEALLTRAGESATELHAAITSELSVYVSQLLDCALDRVQDKVSIGQDELTLTEVEISQTIQLGGSLKASITEVLALTTQGQLVVVARYGRRSP